MLVDPRNSRPFYIGKGKNNRAKQHMNLWRRNEGNLKKNEIISEIIAAGSEPLIIYVCEEMDEDAAFYLEKRLIRTIGFKKLTNCLIPQDNLSRAKNMARNALRCMIHPWQVKKGDEAIYWRIVWELARILVKKHAYPQ
jgi:hypothetical protein